MKLKLLSIFTLVLICTFCFFGCTDSAGNKKTAEPEPAALNISYIVSDVNGDEVECKDGAYNLDPSSVYTVKVSSTGSGQPGFASITADGVNYLSEIASGETVTFKVCGYKDVILTSVDEIKEAENVVEKLDDIIKTFTVSFYSFGFDKTANPSSENAEKVLLSQSEVNINKALLLPSETEIPSYNGYMFRYWSYEDGTPFNPDSDVITSDINLYAVYSLTGENKDIVKLMPANGNTSTAIERDGKAETYNEQMIAQWNNASALSRNDYAPGGIDSLTQAFDDSYGYAEGSYDDSWFVYGIEPGSTISGLSQYITVSGNGTYEVVKSTASGGKVTTGTQINVKDSSGNIVEVFYVVIYGDVNCDGVVNSKDVTAMNNILVSDSVPACVSRAANLNTDSSFTGEDIRILSAYLENSSAGRINQTTGKIN